MPRFYFHFEDHGVRVRDEVGLPLPDAEAAWYQAVRSACDLIRSEGTIGYSLIDRSVAIEDERGLPVNRIPLEEIANFVIRA